MSGRARLTRPRRAVPTQLAALAAGVPEATVRKWASRGKLTRYGRPGRAEYDLDELYALLVERGGGETGG
ncbi:MAG: transcriptional regulator [Actinophytocola sp.]|uniref:transcriptional regulator n=1 Tax=Actinophytocola sp. TaxID=1872138 RepID=UPI003D6C2A5F